jgi:hypothetical protein
MKIELKKIQIDWANSIALTAFTADLYVDGVKVALAENKGYGDFASFTPLKGKEDMLKSAETYCKNLPKSKLSTKDANGNHHEVSMNLPLFVDNIVYKYATKKA